MQGSFALETRHDGLRQCEGAPKFTHRPESDGGQQHDHGGGKAGRSAARARLTPLEHQLTDQSFKMPFISSGSYVGKYRLARNESIAAFRR